MVDTDILLALGAAYKQVQAGEYIFREGSVASFYHQLVSGRVRWSNFDESGKEFIHNLIEGGESFGELPIFDGEPYVANAVADEDCVVLRLHIPVFKQLLTEQPELHFEFSRLLAQRLRFKFVLSKELGSHNPESSILALLKHLKARRKNVCSDCTRINLTRQQIANMTGLRVETVIRTMRNLHDKGKLQIEKGKVYC